MFASHRLLIAVASVAATALTLTIAAPAYAQAPSYRAVPATAVATGNVVAGESLWACGAAGCTSKISASRPAIVCAQAAKKLGKLESFASNGADFDADALTKCNAKAKGVTATLARN